MPNIGPVELLVVLVIAILIVGLAVAILFGLIRAGTVAVFGHDRRLEADLGAQVIRERFARGEISRADAEAGMRALGRDLRGPG